MKTKEELNALKEEVDTLNKKLAELTEEELAQVAGGMIVKNPDGSYSVYDNYTGKIIGTDTNEGYRRKPI